MEELIDDFCIETPAVPRIHDTHFEHKLSTGMQLKQIISKQINEEKLKEMHTKFVSQKIKTNLSDKKRIRNRVIQLQPVPDEYIAKNSQEDTEGSDRSKLIELEHVPLLKTVSEEKEKRFIKQICDE